MKINSVAQSSLAVLLAMAAPVHSIVTNATPAPETAPYCVAVNGGVGNLSGSTFVARNFAFPGANKCTAWTGYTRISVFIMNTSGAACLSGDSTELTVSVASSDPGYLNSGTQAADYLKLSRTGTTGPFSGSDTGFLSGAADETQCTVALLTLPSNHD